MQNITDARSVSGMQIPFQRVPAGDHELMSKKLDSTTPNFPE